MRIMFIFPALYMGFNTLGKGFEQSSINHGLSSISAVLKTNGYDCFLIDMRSIKSWEHFSQVIHEQNFDVCLIGFYSVDTTYADSAIKIIKKIHPTKPIIAGGVHITFNQLDSFSLADTVVWGEGDLIVRQLLDNYQKGYGLPNKLIGKSVTDLDSLPFVDRSLFNIECERQHPILPLLPIPFHTINFSRGCPNFCAYCLESKNYLFKKHRWRSPENCIEELLSLGNLGSLMWHDDQIPYGKWIYEFIELWNKKINHRVPIWCQMRADWILRHQDIIPEFAKIGLTWVSLGIEGSQRFLDFYNKKLTVEQIIEASHLLHDNKVNIFGNYIVGSPTETEQDINELEEILKEIKPEWHSSSIYTSYPGSLLYDYIQNNNMWQISDINDKNGHYSLIRYPFERKILGISYDKIFNEIIPRLTKHKSEYKIWTI